MPQPKKKKFHRKWYEVILTKSPNIGTRADCITRSAALSVNTHPNKAGLVEAVTCDLYDFGKHRRHECVCFPVYADHTVHEFVVHDDVETLHTTTSVFYPPKEVVQRVLLTAAEEGQPFGRAANVLRREPRSLSGFPYCATSTSAVAAKAGLVARTATTKITSKRHGKQTTVTSTFPALPTQEPDCNDKSYYISRTTSACEVDSCMWNFLMNFTSTTSEWITFSDESGMAIRAGWNTSLFLVTTTHWGVYPADSNPGTISVTKATDPWSSVAASAYSRYLTSIGLPPPENHTRKNIFGKEIKEAGPPCQNETDCWQYCEKNQAKMKSQLFQLLGIAALISALALFGMIWVTFCKGSTRASRRRTFPWRRQVNKTASMTTEPVLVETEQGPVIEVMEIPQQPLRSATAGTLSRAAEEGRGRPRVRFSGTDQDFMINGANDGTADGVRKVSGRAAEFEISERGSIRDRHGPEVCGR